VKYYKGCVRECGPGHGLTCRQVKKGEVFIGRMSSSEL
jgi:hypothetical protein